MSEAMLTATKITRIDNARGGRHYAIEGFDEPFPSVTTVLGIINKPALVPWSEGRVWLLMEVSNA